MTFKTRKGLGEQRGPDWQQSDDYHIETVQEHAQNQLLKLFELL